MTNEGVAVPHDSPDFDEWMRQMQEAEQQHDIGRLRYLREHRPNLDDAQRAQSVTCGACEGTGKAWLDAPGVGASGEECPYCFSFRALGYPIGTVDPQARTLPHERETGRRWFQEWADLTQCPTVPPRRFRASGPIARPRSRTEPMPSNWGGVVRHFTRHFTGPRTSWLRQKAFMEGYPFLRADLARRERQRKHVIQWLRIVAQGALIGAGSGMLVLLFVLAWRILHP